MTPHRWGQGANRGVSVELEVCRGLSSSCRAILSSSCRAILSSSCRVSCRVPVEFPVELSRARGPRARPRARQDPRRLGLRASASSRRIARRSQEIALAISSSSYFSDAEITSQMTKFPAFDNGTRQTTRRDDSGRLAPDQSKQTTARATSTTQNEIH